MRAGAVDGGEEAGAVEGEGEVQVVFCAGDGCEAEAGFGCVLEVGAHVCYVEDGGHGGRLFFLLFFFDMYDVFVGRGGESRLIYAVGFVLSAS